MVCLPRDFDINTVISKIDPEIRDRVLKAYDDFEKQGLIWESLYGHQEYNGLLKLLGSYIISILINAPDNGQLVAVDEQGREKIRNMINRI